MNEIEFLEKHCKISLNIEIERGEKLTHAGSTFIKWEILRIGNVEFTCYQHEPIFGEQNSIQGFTKFKENLNEFKLNIPSEEEFRVFYKKLANLFEIFDIEIFILKFKKSFDDGNQNYNRFKNLSNFNYTSYNPLMDLMMNKLRKQM